MAGRSVSLILSVLVLTVACISINGQVVDDADYYDDVLDDVSTKLSDVPQSTPPTVPTTKLTNAPLNETVTQPPKDESTPTTTSAKDSPTTASDKVPPTTTSDESTPTTTSDEVSSTTVSDEVSSTTVSDEVSSTTVSDEVSSTTVSDEVSSTTVSDEDSTTTVSDEDSTTTVSDEDSTTTLVSTTRHPSTNKFDFVVKDEETNVPCILSKMTISIKVRYETKESKTAEATLKVPSTANVGGTCNEDTPTMIISWVEPAPNPETFEDNKSNSVLFAFMKKDSTFSLKSMHIDIYLDESKFPNAKEARLVENSADELGLFAASVQNGIHACSVETAVKVGKSDVTLSDVQLIAFNDKLDVSSRSEENCVAEASVNVGAIVGGVLGGLAVIGIISFIIWKKRKNSMMRSDLP